MRACITAAVVCTVLISLSPLLVSCADDIVYWSDNGHYYQFVRTDNGITYADAKSLAQARFHNSKQGYIVTIGNMAEQMFLNSFMQDPDAAMSNSTIWGGAAVDSRQQWYWTAVGRNSNPFYDPIQGTCYGYCNWAVSNNTSNFPASKSCLQINLDNGGGVTKGTWLPAFCSSLAQAVVVEYDASQTCSAGYVYRTSSGWCEDVNECTNANICGNGYQCVNTIGSYECNDVDECAVTPSVCKSGYQCVNSNGSYSCVDINECKQTPSVCLSGYSCTNTIGSYTCEDINECTTTATCSKGYVCQNTPGSFYCADINECNQTTSPCPFGTKCTNTVGSYTCDSRYYFIQSDYNQLVIDYQLVSGVNRLVTAVQRTDNVTSQLWSLTPAGFIINAKTGQVVDAEGGIARAGVACILWSQKVADQAGNQLWQYSSSTKFWSNAKVTDIVFDIYQARTTAGAPIILWAPKSTADAPEGSANQKWSLVEYLK